ncbi:MAG: LysR family transcriptional regulator [Afipia sp.]|nr:LysR family transcriptional regulator [Afipia sp.]
MELNQVEYFINLAETLNFTTAARLSGVSQPSLTRAIRRLEEELGGPLIYRDGKNSRLTALGQEIEKDFKQVQLALRSARQHSHDWALGSQCVLDIAVAPSVSPNAFTSFFQRALEENPTVWIKIHALQSNEYTAEILSGKYHACILPREPKPDAKLDVRPLFRERFVLGCAAEHPLASVDVVRAADLASFPYVDRLRCEFRDRIQEHFARQEILMRPRFRAEREDWVQRVVADGHAICILPEHSGAVPGLVTRPIEGLSLERELVIVTVSGSTTPVEMRKIAQLASRYAWQ